MAVTARNALLREVSDALGDRTLIWAGLRGSDAESLVDLPQYGANFSMIDAHRSRPLAASVAYEELAQRREDMDGWDIAEHPEAPATLAFRRRLLAATVTPCALATYRASRFLSSIWFARQDRCLNLSLFGDAQRAFEHKPWVEWSIAQAGVPGLDWRYIADEEQLTARDYLADGPVMLRRSTSSGGSGFTLATDAQQLLESWPRQEEGYVGLSRYLPDATPLNVGGVVWRDAVTVHHASVQLVGLAQCTTRAFGHCGNDFAAAKQIPAQVLDQVEADTAKVGRWLAGHGYLGAFGVDYLVSDGIARFTEVNPRFQGSTSASCRLSVETGLPCLLLEHVAAFLGLRPSRRPPLRRQVTEAPDLAQVVVHWTGAEPKALDDAALARAIRRVDPLALADVRPPTSVEVAPGATVARFGTRRALTATGRDLPDDWRSAITKWNTQMKDVRDAAKSVR
ncbi:MAG: hypothetical protein LBD97_01415 [Bifidobacteriaceae bacterium]|jgi:hypothetical protein|nr:hypothetical protein [Bifidobacteriaceae bacterium]